MPIDLRNFVRQALFVSGQSRYIRSVEPPFSLAVVVDVGVHRAVEELLARGAGEQQERQERAREHHQFPGVLV